MRVPMGVIEADHHRAILEEDSQRHRSILDEHTVTIRFEGPATIGAVVAAMDTYTRLGVALELRWLFDESGNRKGLQLYGPRQ